MGKRSNIGMLDTGASHFMLRDERMFVQGSLVENRDPSAVLHLAGGDATLPIKGFGQFVHRNSKGEKIVFNDVLHVPQLVHNLLAAGRLTRAGATTELLKDPHFRLVDRKKELFIGSFVGEGSLMFVGLNPVSHPTLSIQQASQVDKSKLNQLSILKLHYSLGHLGREYILRMWRLGLRGRKLPEGLRVSDFDVINRCRICPLAKNQRLPFKGTRTRATELLQNVHLDLSGIFRTPSTARDHYYVLFTDDYSGFKVEYGARSKNAEDVFEIIKDYIAYSERHTEKRLKKLSIDGGGEFLNDLMIPYCKSKGIVLRVTAPHTPQQNGVAERANRTIASKARAMLVQSGLSTSYWHRAIHHAVFLDNKTITSSLNLQKTPHEMWYKNKPSINHFQPFGCLAYRLIRKEIRGGKLNPVSSPSLLLRIDEHNHNFSLLDLESNRVYVTHDATFQPLIFPARKSEDDINPDWDFIEEDSAKPADDDAVEKERDGPHPKPHDQDGEEAIPDFTIPSETDPVNTFPEEHQKQVHQPDEEEWDQELIIEIEPPAEPLRRSGRDRKAPQRFTPGGNSVKMTIVEPGSYKEAMKSDHAKSWEEACRKEVKNIEEMGVWDIVDRPKDAPVVGGRWHFKIKLNPDGSIAKFKARYVAKGYTQTEGVDYTETFAPTGRLASFRALVSIAASKGWEIHAMDAIAAFLNSVLQETIYMELPEGLFDKERAAGKVARLRKALYGLKQSAKCWSDEIKEKFVSMGMEQNPLDHCLWYRQNSDGEILVYLHVDNMAIT